MKSLGVVFVIIGAISFIAWLALVKVNGLGDATTIAVAIVPVVFGIIGALITADRTVTGVVLASVGLVTFIAWLAYAHANTYADTMTIAGGIVPVVLSGIGAFFIADGIAAANKNPPYDKDPA
ncbi:MAG: hypothetical protein OXI25_00480 [Chloroflexota bacterium]|nr:hypothetical protein [Chloroflexota bacterium]